MVRVSDFKLGMADKNLHASLKMFGPIEQEHAL